jgi:hypothetical protein
MGAGHVFLSYKRLLQSASAASYCDEVSNVVVQLDYRTFTLTRILVSNFCPGFGVSRDAWGVYVALEGSRGWPMWLLNEQIACLIPFLVGIVHFLRFR